MARLEAKTLPPTGAVAWETVVAVVRSLRPPQWVKNVFVFAGVVFAQRLLTLDFLVALGVFGIFCALSSAVYLVNDVADREKDRLHPLKRSRPIAAGTLAVPLALSVAVLLFATAIVASAAISLRLTLVALAYGGLLVVYSVSLKHLVLLDVLVMAIGFVLRAVAGAVAIDVEISGWLLICSFLLALLLALGKRRHEHLTLGARAAGHRPTLVEYNASLLDQMIAVVTASTVMAYALYTMAPETIAKFNTRLLPLTAPFVLYGIFRYLYLLYRRDQGGNPSELFVTDVPLVVNGALWVLAMTVLIYGPHLLQILSIP
jgi:4-hydroxybenzoate polyprenyltransferase